MKALLGAVRELECEFYRGDASEVDENREGEECEAVEEGHDGAQHRDQTENRAVNFICIWKNKTYQSILR